MLKTLISLCVVSVICVMAQPCQAVRLVAHSQPYANETGEVVNILSGDTPDVHENLVIQDVTPWSYPVGPYFRWGVELNFGGHFRRDHERQDRWERQDRERRDRERQDRPNPHRTQPADRFPRHR